MRPAAANPHRYTRATLTVDYALLSLLDASSRPCWDLGSRRGQAAMCAARAFLGLCRLCETGRFPPRKRMLGTRLRWRFRVVLCRDELDLMERLRPGCVEWSRETRWLDAVATVALHYWRKPAVCVDDGSRVLVMSPDEFEAMMAERWREGKGP